MNGQGGVLGIIAGGGALPVVIARHVTAQGGRVFVARIPPFADPSLADFDGAEISLGLIGTRYRAMRAAGVDAVVFAGIVPRVDPLSLSLDEEGATLLPEVLAALKQGDDALLRVLVRSTEAAGFRVIGAEEACAPLLAPDGLLGARAPSVQAVKDIAKGAAVAAALGRFDVGQGVVVCDGLVLAVEAQEGTDRMLERVATLPENVRGVAAQRRGVLVKRTKPIQERRIDLPTIGLATVERAAAAGLSGIAVEAGGSLVLQREEAAARADALGLFVLGFVPAAE